MNSSCRFCGAALRHRLVDLGQSPLSNRFLTAGQLGQMEPFYPLTVYVCEQCLLVQLPGVETPDQIFSDYVYFSSYSDTWLAHVRAYCEAMIARLGLDAGTLVVEIASNDGYLLQYFCSAGIPVLGVEPAANVAAVARQKGVETVVRFFGADTARALATEGRTARLLRGEQRAGARPGPERFRRRVADSAAAWRRDHDGVPAPASLDGVESVRHHLP
jgi:SAM-dependent methyltransferase